MTIIKNRQSCRAFLDEMITDSELETILQSANAAPVGNGVYSDVQLTVIQNKDLLAKLEENTCKLIPSLPAHPLYGLSTVIAISAKKMENTEMAMANASAIAENMLLTATSLGLGSIYLMAVPKTAQYNPELCSLMKIQEGFEPYLMVGVGKAQGKLEERTLTTERIKTEYVR